MRMGEEKMKRYVTLLATGKIGITLLSACGSLSTNTSPSKPTKTTSISKTLISKLTKYIFQANWVNPQSVYVIGTNRQINATVAFIQRWVWSP